MKRVAICLHGYYSNKVTKLGGGTNYIENNIFNKLDKYKYDIFIHSFDIQNKDKIINKYKNNKVKIVIENQIDFSKNVSNNYLINKLKPKHYFTILSFLYSRKQSINYALSFSIENNFEYDIILTARLDLGNRIPSDWRDGLNAGNINFNPSYDMNFIYSALWPQLNAGYADHWFYSNSKNMEIVSLFYDNIIQKYWNVSEDFLDKKIIWIDAKESNWKSKEILKPELERSTTTVNYIDVVFNIHYFYKLYFIDQNLYNKSKFVC